MSSNSKSSGGEAFLFPPASAQVLLIALLVFFMKAPMKNYSFHETETWRITAAIQRVNAAYV